MPTVVENKAFISRAVSWAVGQGIAQLIDLGCGLPTAPNTHQTARTVIPDARVTYVDNDPIVLSHLDALLVSGNRGVTAADGDVPGHGGAGGQVLPPVHGRRPGEALPAFRRGLRDLLRAAGDGAARPRRLNHPVPARGALSRVG